MIKDSGKTEYVQFIDGLAAIPTVKEYAANFVYSATFTAKRELFAVGFYFAIELLKIKNL